jgi:primosomal protein N' (replication factor Y)
MPQPGLIIVDEEHDMGYKQSDMQPRYNARDCAVVMSRLCDVKVVLGSATPSLESYMNAISGKYHYVELKERWGKGVLPEIIISDTIRALKRGERKSHFNLDLRDNINRSLLSGEQVILFQNRRGYAPYLQCRTCGYSPRCPHCNVTLTQHKASSRMECHYCGFTMERSLVCPNCQTQDMATMGFGTEKVEEEVSRLFPEARVVRLDGDTSTSETAFRRIVTSFEQHESDILVGTQIVSKGFDFEGVSTVGILNADTMLNYPDFRSYERAFQLMAQVAGRAGRKNKLGLVILQTKSPDLPVIHQVMRNDYEQLYFDQLAERQLFRYPPFYRLIYVYLKHRKPEVLDQAADAMAQHLRTGLGDRVLGPDKPPIARIQTLFIKKMVVKVEQSASIAKVRDYLLTVQRAIMEDERFRSLIVYYDVDPQ